jgi:hypothetical protein
MSNTKPELKRYAATFTDGHTIKRSTYRTYLVAWRVRWTSDNGAPRIETGFSADPLYRPRLPALHWTGRGCSNAERASRKRLNSKWQERAGVTVDYATAELQPREVAA